MTLADRRPIDPTNGTDQTNGADQTNVADESNGNSGAGASIPRLLPADRPLHPADLSFTVVPHTHWDREWYLPFQQFRMRLVRTVDEILDTLETDPAFGHFTLDGQAVILEDYTELRPEQESRVRDLVAAGRLAIGPSYVLPDEYLASAEALVRNMLVGRRVCQRFGGTPMPVGYMPDPFGHIAQMPQILRGFGLDTFVFWRGLGDEADDLGSIFRWQGLDGSEVIAIRQLGSYGNASQLGRWGDGGRSFRDEPAEWPAVAAARFTRFITRHGDAVRRSGVPEVLLCNGSDHEPIQRDLPALLSHSREVHPGLQVEIGTYAGYVERVRPYLDGQLVRRTGELCNGREAPILRGINSTRMYLKQRYAEVERDLIAAETLATLAWLGGAAYPKAELDHAWREVLRNLPHDSISGCSIDDVHRDMGARFDATGHVAARVRREALAALAGMPAQWTYEAPSGPEQSVVNVLPWARDGIAELPLPDGASYRAFVAVNADGGRRPAQIVRRDGARFAALPVTVAGFGAAPIRIAPGIAEPDRQGVAAWADGPGAVLENERCRVRVHADGLVDVLDRQTGRELRGLNLFEDVADRGDEYNFCPVDGDVPWTSRGLRGRVRVRAWGPFIAEVDVALDTTLPASLAAGRRARSRRRVVTAVRTTIRLAAGSDRVEFTTRVDNRSRDHRLRVLFPAPDARPSDGARAEGHFAVLHRAARPTPAGPDWAEPPGPTAHTAGAIAAGSVAVFGFGLPEYEALEEGAGLTIGLTLLRCVGLLSRDDLTTRPGHAGPGIATPEAQCLGAHTFRYAVRVGEPLGDPELVRASADFRTGWLVGPAGVDPVPALALSGDAVGFSALKRSEDGDAAVLRVFNAGRKPAAVQLDGAFSRAEQSRLDEAAEPGEALADLRAGEIRSIRLTPR